MVVPVAPIVDAATEVTVTGDPFDGLAAGEQFGLELDRDGSTHIVGGDRGAWIVERGETWGAREELIVPGGAPASFGHAVAIDMSDDRQYGIAVVGAPLDSTDSPRAGSVYIFEFTVAAGWQLIEDVSGVASDERLGESVDAQLLSDDRTANVVAGAPNGPGVGYVMSWIRKDGELSAPETIFGDRSDDVGDRFGSAVSLDGATMVVGARFDSDAGNGKIGVGTAAVFGGELAAAISDQSAMLWVQNTSLSLCGAVPVGTEHSSCGTSTGEAFGWSVAVDGNRIVVGAPLRSAAGGGDAGSISIFEYNGVQWEFVTHLYRADAGSRDRFGVAVQIDGEVIAVGSRVSNEHTGTGHIFSFDGLVWGDEEEIIPDSPWSPGGHFGDSLALDGNQVTFGAPLSDGTGDDAGMIWPYEFTVDPPNYPPVFVDDSFTTWPSDSRLIDVLANDSDPEGQPLTIGGFVSLPAHGTVNLVNGATAIDYVPDAGFGGVDTFEYRVSDGFRSPLRGGVVTVTVGSELRIGDVQVDENAGTAEVAVVVDPPALNGVTFTASYVEGSATTPQDYTPGFTALAIEPGGTGLTISVPIVDDAVVEGNETFQVTLSDVVGAEPLDAEATVTIVSEDAAAPISATIRQVGGATGDITVTEDVGSVNFEVVLSEAAAVAADVQFVVRPTEVSPNPAEHDVDYDDISGTAVFAPGETEIAFVLPIHNNQNYEGTERFEVVLTAATPTGEIAVGSPDALFVTIDDEGDNAEHPGPGDGAPPVPPTQPPPPEPPTVQDICQALAEGLNELNLAVPNWWVNLDLANIPGIPNTDSAFPELFDSLQIGLTECPGVNEWNGFLNWLEEQITGQPEGERLDSEAPNAGPDFIKMEQGTTIAHNVIANDHDLTFRGIYTTFDGPYVDGQTSPDLAPLPPGLTAVNMGLDGIVTVIADSDFVGQAQFFYSLCAVGGNACATGTVIVDILDGPPPPVLRPDHISIGNDEVLKFEESTTQISDRGPNVLSNDEPDSLTLRSVDSVEFVTANIHADGHVELTHIGRPGLVDDGPAVEYELPYSVCEMPDVCDSTLHVYYRGEYGPDTEPDFVNANRTATANVYALRNDADPEKGERLVIVEAWPAAESTDSVVQVQIVDGNRVDITMSATPNPESVVLYQVCRAIGDGEPDLDRCATEVITIYTLDRIAPEARDDHFDVPVGAAYLVSGLQDAYLLDVVGNGGGGADVVYRRAFVLTDPVIEGNADIVAVSPEGELPRREIPFAGLIIDGGRLLLTPPATAALSVPEPGWTAEFDYQLCDLAALGADGIVESLCDTATVTIEFIDQSPADIEAQRYPVSVWPGEDEGSWEIPFGQVHIPPTAAFTSISTSEFVIQTEFSSHVPSPYGYLSGEWPTEFFHPANPGPGLVVPVTQRSEARFIVGEPDQPGDLNPDDVIYNEGEVESKIVFVRNQVLPLPAVVEVGVDGVDIDLADFVRSAPFTPEYRLETLDGKPAIGSNRDYKFYTVDGPTDAGSTTIRIDANPGVGGIARALPYRVCGKFTADHGRYDDNHQLQFTTLEQEICHDGLLMLTFDTTSGGIFHLRTAGAPQFPFESDIDTYLEFVVEQKLSDFVSDDDAPFTLDDEVLAGLDELLFSNGVDINGSALADATWSLIVGVDPDGLYVGGDSQLAIDVAAVGTGSVSPTLFGQTIDTSVTATGLGAITIRLGNPGERLRVADLVDGPDFQVDYEAILGVRADVTSGVVTASPYAITTFGPGVNGPVVDGLSVVVPVTIALPGAVDENGDPAVIEMQAAIDNGQLRVTGNADVPPGYAIDGIGLRDLSVDLMVADSSTNGTISAIVDIEVLDIEVPVTITIDGDNVSAAASVDVGGTSIGPDGSPFLTIDKGTLSLVLVGNTSTGTAAISAGIQAQTVHILPGNGAGTATLTNVDGSIGSGGGAQTLSFGSLTAGTPDFAAISTGVGTLTLGDSSRPLIALNNVQALDTGGVSVAIGRLEFYDDGRVVVLNGCVVADSGLADSIGIAGVLPFDVTSACLDGDEITVTGFFNFDELADWPFTPTISIGSQTVSVEDDTTLPTNQFTFTFDANTLEPINLGPITVGIEDLQAGGVSASGSFTIGGYTDGTFDGTFAGSVNVEASGALNELPLGGALDVAIGGEVTFDDNGSAVLDLEAEIGATGFLGEYLELTSGDLSLTTTITVADDLSIDVAGPGLTSADLAGVIRIPGLESSADSGGIPVTLQYATTAQGGELVATAGGGATYTAGGHTFSDVSGEVRVSNADGEISASGELSVGAVSGTIADLVDYAASGATLDFDTDAATPLLRIDGLAATLPDPDDPAGPPLASLTIDYIEIADDGTLSSGVITATELDRLANRFGFGDLFPFTLTGLRIDPTDLADVQVTVAGDFNFTRLEELLAPATFSAQIGAAGSPSCADLGVGGAGVDTFCFTVAVDALSNGAVTPIDFGPISVAVEDLDVAGVVGSADFTIGGYTDGTFDGAFAGSVDVATDLGGALNAEFAAIFDGNIGGDGAGGAEMAIIATVAAVAGGGGVEASAEATFRLTISADSSGNIAIDGPVIESAEAQVCIEIPGFTSDADCDGVYATVAVDGNIWTASVATSAKLGDATNGLTVEGLNGTLIIDVTDPDNPVITGQLSASRIHGVVGGRVEIETGVVTFNFDTDTSTALLEPVDIIGRLLADDGAVLAQLGVDGLTVSDAGVIGVAVIRVTQLEQLAEAIGVANILPFGISGAAVEFVGDDITQPEALVVRVAGTFDLSAIAEYDPVVELGGGANGDCDGLASDPANAGSYGGTFCFAVAIDDQGVHPVSFGPITLGLRKVEIGSITMAGEITLGGYQSGVFVPTASGYLEIEGETELAGDSIGASARLDLAAVFGGTNDLLTLDIAGTLQASLKVGPTLLIEEATVSFGLDLQLDLSGSGGPALSIDNVTVHSVSADVVQVSAGGIVTFRLENPEFPLSEEVFIRLSGGLGDDAGIASLSFGASGEDPIDGWGGTVRGFEIGMDGAIYLLPGFGITVTGANAASLGLDEWIPISVTEAGIVFNGDSPADLIDNIVDRRRLEIDDFTDVTLIVSAELTGTDVFPVFGSVEGLEVNVRYLQDWVGALAAGDDPPADTFPVTNLEGVSFGVQNLELGPVTVSGGLGFGVVDTDQGPKLWGRVVAGGTYDGIGLSIDMTITERGPISLKVDVPAAVVLGQTGIVLAIKNVAVAFNKEIPSICTTFDDGQFTCGDEDPDGGEPLDGPLALVNADVFDAPNLATIEEIRAAVEEQFSGEPVAIDNLASLLPEQFALSIEGSITHLAVAGQLSGDVQLTISFDKPSVELPLPGIRIIGTGNLNVYGMSIAEAKIYLDYSDPLAPAVTIAAQLPGGGGLLDLLIPGTAQFGITLDTQGTYAAPILAVRELVLQIAGPAATDPQVQQIFGPLLDEMLARLNDEPNSALAILLLDVDKDGIVSDAERVVIERSFFNQRVQTLLSPDETPQDGSEGDSELLFGQGLDDLILASEFAVAVINDLLAGAADLSPLDVGLPADTTIEDYIAAAVSVFRSVLIDSPEIFQVFYDVLNPSLILQGVVQYELFDIPLGEPAQEALIVIDKNEVYVEFTQSLKQTSSMALAICYPCLAVTQALTAGLDDRTTMTFRVPFPIQQLIDGEGLAALDPFSGGWSMSIGSQLFVFGFEAGTIDGLIVPGDSADQVATWVAQLAPNLAEELSVPPALAEDGGVFVTGALQVPDLLVDPLGWLATAESAIGGIDDVELFDLPTYLQDNADELLKVVEIGNLDIFLPLPTPAEIADAGLDISEGLDLSTVPGTTLDLVDDLFVRADLGARLLGYTMVNADFELTADGMQGSVEFPFFGAPLQAKVASVVLAGQDAVDEVSDLVRWPVVSIDETVTLQDVEAFLDDLGLPNIIPSGLVNDSEASIRIRAFSPMSHLAARDPAATAAADPLQETGGFEIIVESTVSGLLEGGRLVISVGFGVDGSLLPSSVEATIAADEITVGAVTINNVSLTYTYDNPTGALDGGTVDVILSGTTEVLGLIVHLNGSLSSGRLEATFGREDEKDRSLPLGFGLKLSGPNSATASPTIALIYDSDTGAASIEIIGRLYLPEWSGYATVDALIGSGNDAITAKLVGLNRDGIRLGGSASFTSSPAGFDLVLNNATLTIPGLIDTVTVSGHIDEQGLQSLAVNNIAFGLALGVGLECADISFEVSSQGAIRLSGSANIVVAGLTELVTPSFPGPGGFGLPPKAAPGPAGCQSNGINASFDNLTPLGYGRIELQVEDLGIGPVKVRVDSASIARSSSKAELELDGQVNVLNSLLNVDGSFSVGGSGLTGSVALSGAAPDLFGWGLDGQLSLDVAPGTPVRFGFDGKIEPVKIKPISVKGWIESDGDFSLAVQVPRISIAVGRQPLKVGGSFLISRVGNQMQLRIRNGVAGVGFLGDVEFEELIVNSDGAFAIEDLNVSRIGTAELGLVSARLDLSRTANGVLKVRLKGGSITGTFLNGRSFSAFDSDGISAMYSTNMAFHRRVSAGSLNLGPALNISSIRFDIDVDNDGLDVKQVSTVNVTALSGSANMKIQYFDLHVPRVGAPSLSGEVTGKLSVLGRRIGEGSFTVSSENSALKMTLSTEQTINMGLLGSFDVDGWFRSDGQFDFGAAFAGEYGLSDPLGILEDLKITVDGEIALAVGTGGATTGLVGTGCGPFPTKQYPFLKEKCGTAKARLASNNVLTGSITVGDQSIPFSFPLGVQPAKATSGSAPSFGEVKSPVMASVKHDVPEFTPVHYLELFNLVVDGEDSIACSPPSGGLFQVGAITEVFCTAINEFGADTVEFDVQVVRQLEPQVFIAVTVPSSKGGGKKSPPLNPSGDPILDQGGQITMSGKADAGSHGRVVAHSTPTELGTFMADANGDWELTVTIPASLEIGEHTLVIDSVVDGVRTLAQVPIEVVAAATEPDPGADLPATGGNAHRAPTIALWILLAGLVLLALTKRRRSANCPV